MTYAVQRGGRVRLGSGPGSVTDYTNDFTMFQIDQIRNTVVKPASPGSPHREQKAASHEAFVNVMFAANEGDSSGVWQVLNAARASTTGEVYFDVVQGPGSVSATNPKWTGYMVVTGVGAGVGQGQLKQQVRTFPARGVSDPITSE